MQDKKYLATIVPLGPQARKQIQKGENLDVIRAAVWSETAKKLTPLLGSVCSRFLPATYAWSICNYRPFGVMLGGVTADMEDMLLCYPRLRADLSLYKTPYPDFPIPRLVFGFSVGAADGAVSACRIGVIADETPTPDTIMYHYPFSNVDSSGSLCIGANTLPKYKELRKAAGLPALLLSIPNNFDRFDPSDNQLGLDYRDLMQHLKDKEPAYYYTDILIPNGQTLAHFIQHM